MQVKAIVLAAGKGTRLGSEQAQLPKVMRSVLGRPMLSYVLDTLRFIPPQDITIVVGFLREMIVDKFGSVYQYAVQDPQLGTGHAVFCAESSFSEFSGPILVCYGDMPLVHQETYEALLDTHLREGNACTLLTGSSTTELGFGRVLCDHDGHFQRVIEFKDCTPEQKKITMLNAGIYIFDAALLRMALPRLKNQNAAGEYYLTDVPALLLSDGHRVGICHSQYDGEILGVNTLEQLSVVEQSLREREKERS